MKVSPRKQVKLTSPSEEDSSSNSSSEKDQYIPAEI